MCFLTQSCDACSYDKVDASNLFTPELRKQARLIPPAELRTVYQNTPTPPPPLSGAQTVTASTLVLCFLPPQRIKERPP